MKDYERLIAEAGLDIKATKLNPNNPFQWASGFRMPIYNDNRMFLFYPQYRSLITDAFDNLMIPKPAYSIIAGTSTAGIPWGAFLADKLGAPFIYVRDKPKDHGLKNQIEGIGAESDLQDRIVVLIEDLISTGGSSAGAVQAIRDANGICNSCLSIFNYGFDEAGEIFEGKRPYDKEGKKFLKEPCNTKSIVTYDLLLEVAKEREYINAEQAEILGEWRANPFTWGEKHGFPRVEKGGK